MPEGRIATVLRSLIDSPQRFLQFLRALLGGIEGITEWADDNDSGTASAGWNEWFAGETLLEDLMRVASRDPGRLAPVRRLIDDLRATEEGRRIVPDDFMAVWTGGVGSSKERPNATRPAPLA